jgi:peptidoglycan/LPS O-acetylase OafA/YrhL
MLKQNLSLAPAAGASPNADFAPSKQSPVLLNNISLLRLLFAYSVALSHAAVLLGGDDLLLLRKILNSEAAVQGFFILSGGLVVASYERLRNPAIFYRRRLSRIFPAYALAVLIFAACSIGDAVLSGRMISLGQIAGYLAANLTTLNFLQPEIDGVFAANPYATINGALWSIKVELMFYATVPLLVLLMHKIGIKWMLFLMLVTGGLWWPILQLAFGIYDREPPLSLYFQVPGQVHFFALGIGMFAHAQGRLSAVEFGAMIALVLGLLAILGNVTQVERVLALMAFILVVTRLPQLPFSGIKNDFSYGIYLAHFPIIQLLIANGATELPLIAYFAALSILAFAYGWFSWNVIERPAMRHWGKQS